MNLYRFIRELVQADQHRGGIQCLQLFHVEAAAFERMRREVATIRNQCKPSSVGDADHVTHWTGPHGQVTQYSLLNTSGSTADFTADHDLSCRGKRFVDPMRFPTIGRWVEDWPHLINCRINVLEPGASLSAHEEHVPFRTQEGTIGARLRFHLPVETDAGAELNLDGAVFHLTPGVVHLVNQGCVHAACNKSSACRVHLVWDALLTQELYDFLFDSAQVPEYLKRIPDQQLAHLVRHEAPGPHRRMPPNVSAADAMRMNVCRPQ